MSSAWRIRLVAIADRDYQEIVKRSAQDFGARQARAYAKTMEMAITALREKGPETIGAKKREEIGPGLFSLHAARGRRKASHFLLFRVRQNHTIEILRILHERMDLARHI